MAIRIALPKGKLLPDTAALLEKSGWGMQGYTESLRNYRVKSDKFPDIQLKVLHEKDIPIQVAIGNYDIGICGLDWLEELTSKYSATSPVRIRDLGFGKGALYVAASSAEVVPTLEQLNEKKENIRIVSEYPNIAETFALDMRLKRFSIYPVWGAAEAYPPESATLALMAGDTDEKLLNNGLKPLSKVLDFSAFLIANRESWTKKNLSEILATLGQIDIKDTEIESEGKANFDNDIRLFSGSPDVVRLALADGHQQKPTIELLEKAGIPVPDYISRKGNRRPQCEFDWLEIKMIRPQDMPSQVANGNFDLAITGKDWVTDHLNVFPSSPVHEIVDLGFGWVKIVAVVSQDVAADNIYDLSRMVRKNTTPIRVASEYVNIADKYARENRLGMYRIIPTWGATEAFLPEDADLLIENTETGGTIARHNLKIIDTLFESTAHLIGVKDKKYSQLKKSRLEKIVNLFSEAVKK